MSKYAATVANAFIAGTHDLDQIRYLELGTERYGYTFWKIFCKNKFAVDVLPKAELEKLPDFSPEGGKNMKFCENYFEGTTDAFFLSCKQEDKWDVIFIDADHEFIQVAKDYNNSIDHITEGGIIILHDLFPPSKSIAINDYAEHYGIRQPLHSGDCFKLLYWARKHGIKELLTLDDDYGLTAIRQKHTQKIVNYEKGFDLSYEDLLRDSFGYNRSGLAEMVRIVRTWGDERRTKK